MASPLRCSLRQAAGTVDGQKTPLSVIILFDQVQKKHLTLTAMCSPGIP
jgi:hypothetical protein